MSDDSASAAPMFAWKCRHQDIHQLMEELKRRTTSRSEKPRKQQVLFGIALNKNAHQIEYTLEIVTEIMQDAPCRFCEREFSHRTSVNHGSSNLGITPQ